MVGGRLWSGTAWVAILALWLPSYVTLVELLSFSESLFPHLYNEDHNIPPTHTPSVCHKD